MKAVRFWCGGAVIVACALAGVPLSADAQDDMSFELNIALSERAAARLAAPPEGITVYTSYYGDPKPGAEQHANEVGQIDLGQERTTVPGKPGPVHISGSQIDRDRLGWIDGPVMINVNVASARESDPDNLLACDFIDGELAEVRKAPTTLRCALIEENPETELRP